MMERSETFSPPAHLCAGWGLNLTAQRRKRLLGCRLLRLVTPFLALGGRYLLQAAAARSLGLLTAMPWLAPRWLERPERDAAPAHVNEPVMHPPMATTLNVTSPPVRTPSEQQAQPLIALALVSPFSGEQRTPAPSSPTPAEPVVHPARTKRETAKMGSFFSHTYILPKVLPSHSDMARQTDDLSVPDSKATDKPTLAGALHIQPQILPYHAGAARRADNLPVSDSKATDKQTVAGARGEEAVAPPGSGRSSGSMPSRLPKMTPLWGPLGGFRYLTPGTSPSAFYRIMTTAAPGHRAKQAELLFQSPPEAGDTQEMPPLPEHKLHGGPETVAPAVSLQGLSLALETIRHTMKREVAAAIREREEEAQSLASNRSSGIDMTSAGNLVSDNMVRLFMQKMRKLAEEERFRLGLLR
ncbi:hypothetical protein Psch_01429 [Pelotomaculum schinkii]|uniref:Uncharacterized protein n=1 Tax=Pelotomaculum schinkii TaxID=78350 RepID=A0A4Y7RFV8_9FIRM|nr:hypothetical protein [Pelotomaculum schinkii]TEB07874.1 hypothetical protein Psch_01429 [Pelotomaculum schinkii]